MRYIPNALKTAVMTVLIFVTVAVCLELLFRYPPVEAKMPVPSLGGGYTPLEQHLANLRLFAREHEGVECIWVGSSMLRVGLNPITFSEGYQKRTGEPIACFNMGISTMTVQTAAQIAAYLIHTYEPDLLIYAAGIRDFNSRIITSPSEQKLPSTAWMRYQQGHFSLEGWMLTHLRSYSYLKGLPETLEQGWHSVEENEQTSISGFFPRLTYNVNLSPTISLLEPWRELGDVSARFVDDFELSPTYWEAFRDLIALDGQHGTQLMIIEMPTYMGGKILDLDDPNVSLGWRVLNEQLKPYALEHDIPFWTTSDRNLINPWDWQDPIHLYVSGVDPFSRWLGEQVGEAVERGVFEESPPPALLADPPLGIQPQRPNYRQTYGLSTPLYEAFRHYQAAMTLVPPGSPIFNPANYAFDRAFLLEMLGLFIQWNALEQPDAAASVPDDQFELLAVLEQMRFANDLSLTAEQQAALGEWRATKLPRYLQAAGIEYLIVDSNWLGWLTSEELTALTDASHYELLKTWQYMPTLTQFSLYHVVGEQASPQSASIAR